MKKIIYRSSYNEQRLQPACVESQPALYPSQLDRGIPSRQIDSSGSSWHGRRPSLRRSILRACILALALPFLLLGGLWLTGRFDPGPILYGIKIRMEGKDPSDCLSWPEHYWRLFDGCGGGAENNWGFPSEDEPSRGGDPEAEENNS